MKLKFEFTYDTETGAWFFEELEGDQQAKDNNARLRHSGSSYLRVKVGDYQIGTVGCYMPYKSGEGLEAYDQRCEGTSPCTISMTYPIPDEIKASFK